MQDEINSKLNYLGQSFVVLVLLRAASCKKSSHFVGAIRRLDD